MNAVSFPGFSVGDYTVTAISDGYLSAGLDLLSNIDPALAARMQQEAGQQDANAVHINTYLLRGGGRTVLIDSGAGGMRGWGGQLLANLRLLGVEPASIDTVLLTHAHPDHVGGLLDAQGRAVFAQAELVLQEQERRFWLDDGNLAQASERAQGNFRVARQVFDVYGDRLRPLASSAVLPGINAVALPGHTAGHTGYLIEGRDAGLLVWGDVVHFPHIQIARPDVAIAFDQDASLAAATRGRLLDQVSGDGLLVAGMHLGAAAFARVHRAGPAYELSYADSAIETT